MTDLYVEGPDTVRLLSDLSINNYKNFGRNKAKQIVCCSHEGHVIGDAVLFGLDDFRVNIVGRPHIPNWVQYNAVAGGYDVVVERDERTTNRPLVERHKQVTVRAVAASSPVPSKVREGYRPYLSNAA